MRRGKEGSVSGLLIRAHGLGWATNMLCSSEGGSDWQKFQGMEVTLELKCLGGEGKVLSLC